MIVSLLHAWLSITVKADQIISGTIINIAAVGVTGYLFSLFGTELAGRRGVVPAVPSTGVPTGLPFVGWIFQALFNQGPITISLVFIVIVLQIMLFRTRWGSALDRWRAPQGGRDGRRRCRATPLPQRCRSGHTCGARRRRLSMETTSSFQTEMTAGRRFIGLAAMIFGRWTPLGAFGAALLFASSQSISLSIQFVPPTGQLGDLLTSLPKQFYDALPYIITIIVLTGLIGRSTPPAADGQPYEREAAT